MFCNFNQVLKDSNCYTLKTLGCTSSSSVKSVIFIGIIAFLIFCYRHIHRIQGQLLYTHTHYMTHVFIDIWIYRLFNSWNYPQILTHNIWCLHCLVYKLSVLSGLRHSHLTAATRVRYPASACEMVIVVTKSDRWVSSGHSGFLPVRKTNWTQTSVPTSMTNISCIYLFRNHCKFLYRYILSTSINLIFIQLKYMFVDQVSIGWCKVLYNLL